MRPASASWDMSRPAIESKPLLIILAVGLCLRLILLIFTAETPLQIDDEQHYHQLARSLLDGYGYAWGPGQPTSLRPPLYPAFIAGVWFLSGADNLVVIRAAQIVLSLLTVGMLYLLALRVFGYRVALLCAGMLSCYPSTVGFNFLILTETVFTFLLVAFLLGMVSLLQTGRPAVAWWTGCLLGLAALTRSVLWPLPLLLVPLLFWKLTVPAVRRAQLIGLLCIGYLIVVGPWAVRNTLLQHTVTVVDSMGGITMRMGNYEYTPINRAWDPMTLHGEHSVYAELRAEHPDVASWTEGQKEKWAQRKAVAYMLEHPGTTIHRSLIKFANFWGLERTLIAGWQQGLYHPPAWFVALGTVLIPASYAGVMLAASVGLFLAAPAYRGVHAVFLLLLGFITLVHTVVFGHPRYHLPLIPILCLYGSNALLTVEWRAVRASCGRIVVPALVCLLWIGIWSREIVLVESERIRRLIAVWLG